MIIREIAPNITIKRTVAHEPALPKPVKRARVAPIERAPEPAVHTEHAVAPQQSESIAPLHAETVTLGTESRKAPAVYDHRGEAVHEHTAASEEAAKPLPSPEEAIVQVAAARNRQARIALSEEAEVALGAAGKRARIVELGSAERAAAARLAEEQRALETRTWAAALSPEEGDAAIARIDSEISALVRSGADGSPKAVAALEYQKGVVQDAQLERARRQQNVQRELALQKVRKQTLVDRMKSADRVHKQHLEAQKAHDRRAETVHHEQTLAMIERREHARRTLANHFDQGQRNKLLQRGTEEANIDQEIAKFQRKGFGPHESALAASNIT